MVHSTEAVLDVRPEGAPSDHEVQAFYRRRGRRAYELGHLVDRLHPDWSILMIGTSMLPPRGRDTATVPRTGERIGVSCVVALYRNNTGQSLDAFLWPWACDIERWDDNSWALRTRPNAGDLVRYTPEAYEALLADVRALPDNGHPSGFDPW